MSCKLLFNFPNNRYLPSRSERFSEHSELTLKFPSRVVLNERVAGGKKKDFFAKPWPKTLFQKNSGGRICVRTREKCSQSTETLKKWSTFVYSAQRKTTRLRREQNLFFSKKIPKKKVSEKKNVTKIQKIKGKNYFSKKISFRLKKKKGLWTEWSF